MLKQAGQAQALETAEQFSPGCSSAIESATISRLHERRESNRGGFPTLTVDEQTALLVAQGLLVKGSTGTGPINGVMQRKGLIEQVGFYTSDTNHAMRFRPVFTAPPLGNPEYKHSNDIKQVEECIKDLLPAIKKWVASPGVLFRAFMVLFYCPGSRNQELPYLAVLADQRTAYNLAVLPGN